MLIFFVSIPTSRPDINATSLAVGMGLVLGIHVFARPFYHEINNKLETFSLFCGFCVSILNIMLDKPTFYNYATAFFALAPLAPIPFLMYQFIGQKSPITYAVVDGAVSRKLAKEKAHGGPELGGGDKTLDYGMSVTERRKGAKTDAQVEREEILMNKRIKRWETQVCWLLDIGCWTFDILDIGYFGHLGTDCTFANMNCHLVPI